MNPGEKQKGSRAYAKPHLLKQIASKNAYERQRNENVASNIKYMVDCGLSQAAKTFNRSLGIGGNDQRYSGNKRDSRDENYEPPEGDTRESSGYETGDYIASTHKHTKKDLDLTKPGIQRSPKRAGFETNTEEVVKKADFRALFPTSRKTHTDGALCPSRIRTHDKSGPGRPGQRVDLHKDSTLTSTSERLPSRWSLRVQKNISSGPVPKVSAEVAPVPALHSIDIANGGNLVASSFTRQVRGKNRGKGTEYLVSKYGKLSVEIPEAFNVPVGLNANPLINELSKDIKALAPIQGIKYWRDIDPSIRESIIQRSRDKFNIKDYDADERVRNAINKKCSRGYCNWKSMLYRHYMALLKAGKDPKVKENIHSTVKDDDWIYLIDHVWISDSFKARSEKAKFARSKLLTNHSCGSRSIPSTMTIMAENNNGQFPHIEDVYKKSHWSEKKNDWISDECRIRYEKFEEIRQECENTGKIMSEEEISKVVLGARKCYIKGFGPGYRPSSYRGRTSTYSEDNVEVTSLKMALEVQKSQHENLKKEHENLKDFVHTVLGRAGLLQDGYGDGDGNDEEDGSEEDDSQEEDN